MLTNSVERQFSVDLDNDESSDAALNQQKREQVRKDTLHGLKS